MTFPSLSAAAASLMGVALFAVTTATYAAQPVQGPPDGHPPAGGQMPHRPAPAPTNLKVLPKDLTGDQVHEIMHHWAGDLGVECGFCHAADPTKKAPNGHPMLNFPDDSKKEKATARLMVTMMEDVNKNYIMKMDNDGKPVSCGTCHRGHKEPEAFVPPPDHDHDHHEAPPAGQQPPLPH